MVTTEGGWTPRAPEPAWGAQGWDVPPAPYPVPPPRRPSGARRAVQWIGVGVAAVVALAVLGVASGVLSLSASVLGTAPTPGFESSSQPLGQPPVVPENAAYSFMGSQRGANDVVSYDPCRPIHFVVNPAHEPADGFALIDAAVANLSAATGFTFVDDGPTTEPITENRAPFQPDRYGDRWAPVLIAWTTPEEDPGLRGDVVGDGGSIPVTIDGHPPTYVTGRVALDAPQLAKEQTLVGPAYVRAVIQHELAHVLGLGHTTDPGQIMYPEANLQVMDFGAGDRAGLARLGRAPCAPHL